MIQARGRTREEKQTIDFGFAYSGGFFESFNRQSKPLDQTLLDQFVFFFSFYKYSAKLIQDYFDKESFTDLKGGRSK